MTDPEPTSDFGYDLVHDDMPRPDRRGAPGTPHSAPPWAGRPGGDDGEDLGYDDAHDF
jgi:hypothetical protein